MAKRKIAKQAAPKKAAVKKPARKPARKAAPKAAPKAAKVTRKLISSGSPWEPKMGYSRAVRVGNAVYVSGTTGLEADGYYGQAKKAIEKILAAVAPEGVRAEHCVRTRMYVVDITKWNEVADAHGEIFRDIRPATAIVQVPALIEPGMLIEIEADFVIP
jgi:enamine deaminase RidA (YjgF/YER057c/UK114 family)